MTKLVATTVFCGVAERYNSVRLPLAFHIRLREGLVPVGTGTALSLMSEAQPRN